MRSGIDPDANFEAARALVVQAAKQGASLIATPEMTGLLQRRPNAFWNSVKSQNEDLLVSKFSNLANDLGVTLLVGSLAIRTGEKRAANRSFLFGRDGRLIATYDKIHLFDVNLGRGQKWQESAMYDGGKTAVLSDIDGAKLGLTICYDVRFAGLYRKLAQAGAQIIAVPAAFTVTTGQAHWETLLRARAIETGSFILAPAQGGPHEDGRTTWGRSMIVGPWGDIIAVRDNDTPGIVIADIDLTDADTARAKVPAWGLNAEISGP